MQDPMWIRGLLGVHIAAGTVSFVMAPVALTTAKGGCVATLSERR